MIESYATVLYESGILDQAAAVLEGRLLRNGTDLDSLATLGEIYRKQGRLEEGAAVYTRVVQFRPDDAHAKSLQAILAGEVPPEWAPEAPLQPVPFVRVPDFLPQALHDTLLPRVLAAPGEDVVASTVGMNEYRPDTRMSYTVTGLQDLRDAFWEHVAALLPSVLARLQLPPFKVGSKEVRIRTYRAGNFFEVHRDDSLPESADRRISFVYFFHRVPRRFSGGDLMLIDTNPDGSRSSVTAFTRIVPVDNSLVLFPSRFYHAVVPVECASPDPGDSRFVINGHVHRDPAGVAAQQAHAS
jgi:2OG-Fe(II) oxygenase superfamily/Tetratricopeptide repeat